MNRTIGTKISIVLIGLGGVAQLINTALPTALIGFVFIGSLLLGLAMLIAAWGIWKLARWGRIMGVIIGAVEAFFGLVMGTVAFIGGDTGFADIILGLSGVAILYLLLFSKAAREAFRH